MLPALAVTGDHTESKRLVINEEGTVVASVII
jgi:hypothetical protein